MSASPEAWRWLAWLATDPQTGKVRRLPIAAGGPFFEESERAMVGFAKPSPTLPEAEPAVIGGPNSASRKAT